jgi:hypothetical protein
VLNSNEIDKLVDGFLEQVGNSVHNLLCSNNIDDYKGLDCDRDTEKEVETAIRFFPEVLSRRGGSYNEFPIQIQLYLYGSRCDRCHLKAVSFIPLLARLAIEFSVFEENERGGLLITDETDNNVLQLLTTSSHPNAHDLEYFDEHCELVDRKFLHVIIKLMEMDLFKKEDICNFNLLIKLCRRKVFAKHRFHFFCEKEPNVLTQPASAGIVPLLYAAINTTSIEAFRAVFKAVIHFFPKKKGIGLLFRNTYCDTPFETACHSYGRDKVVEVIELTLSNCSDKLNNFVDTFLSSAIDEGVSLDCVLFLLRRDPDMLQKLLSSSTPLAAMNDNSNNTDGGNIDKNDYDYDEYYNLKKRKLKEKDEDDVIFPTEQ